MYGRLNQRKLKEQDFVMSCEKARQQLDQYIDIESKRVNIDSAKKRAVLQHMDYQGFRQMVLGANIFPTKSQQLYYFSKGENPKLAINKLFTQLGEQVIQPLQNPLTSHQIFRNVQGKSQLLCCSFRQFKKAFTYPISPNILSPQIAQSLYTLLKLQDEKHLSQIFNMECQANILVKIVGLFQFVVGYLKQQSSDKIFREIAFQIKFFQTVLLLKNIKDFNLTILSRKEKSKIVAFLQHAKQILNTKTSQDNTEQPEDDKVIDNLVKILKK